MAVKVLVMLAMRKSMDGFISWPVAVSARP